MLDETLEYASFSEELDEMGISERRVISDQFLMDIFNILGFILEVEEGESYEPIK